MANIEQGLRRLSKHRYSIKQLLALSGNSHAPFDLSKFSFDAARAGVIPTLDDCGMSSRRTSITRHRISSTETASTTEQAPERSGASFHPSDPIHAPERRPQPPPVSLLAQQNTGFAKFLKKHTSPTHQRVTAGGRIVPMEPHFPPPPFVLSGVEKSQPAATAHTSEHGQPAAQNFANSIAANISDNPKYDPCSRSSSIPAVNRPSAESNVTSRNRSGKGDLHAQPCNTSQQNMAQTSFLHGHQPLPSAIEIGASSCASFIPRGHFAYSPWQNMYGPSNNTLFPASGEWPFVDGMHMPQEQHHGTAVGHLAQPILWAQNALLDWTQRYNELDQQLKALDRHRAMTNLTSDIAIQRREIVQHRSDSKNMINLIGTWLNLSEQVHPGASGASFTPTFNANAPAYIPVAQKAPQDFPVTNHNDNNTALAQIDSFSRPPIRPARRPIAIVPPPKVETDLRPARKQHNASPESPGRDDVDSWGVKIGPAPPELRRQQSEILESISEAHSQSSVSNNSRESLQSVPQGGFFQKGTTDKTRDFESRRSYYLDPCIPTVSVQAYPSLENVYAGTPNNLGGAADSFTMARKSNGDATDVEGKKIQYSRNTDSFWFEKDAETRKVMSMDAVVPDGGMDKHHLEKYRTATPTSQLIPVEERKILENTYLATGDRKENISIQPSVHRKAATDAFLINYNHGESQNQPLSSQNVRLPFRKHARATPEQEQQLLENRGDQNRVFHLGAERLTNRGDRPTPECFSGSTCTSPPEAQFVFSNAVSRSHASRTTGLSTEALSNKGYSSISVQNVNVVAQLPQNLDGTTDSGKSSRSIFSLVGKVKSPRLLRRTVANGGA